MATTPSRPAGPAPGAGRVEQGSGQILGLDGVRALAILAVLVFHLRAGSLPGGYLGVDVFFVVSGFLITTLLLRELHAHRRLDLPRFWLRRARRLLPALVLVVVVSISLGWVVGGDLLVHIGRQTLGALTFSNNWLEIAAGSDYFTHTSPLLFMNFWSLAVEEQFYLFWPITLAIIVACLPTARGRLRLVLGLAAASALAMAVVFGVGGDSTRVYYGTDTHLFGLMIGAALAFAWAAPAAPLDDPRWTRFRTPAALASLGGLVLLMLTLEQDSAPTFRGGLVLASVLTAVLIAGLLGADSALRRALQATALAWLGERSYGIYLWHWPVILLVSAALPATVPDSSMSWLVRGLSLGVTLVVSAASYQWLEMPVRRLGFIGSARAFGRWVSAPWAVTRVPRLTAATVVVLVAVSGMAIHAAPDTSEVQRQIEAGEVIADSSLAGSARAVPRAGAPRTTSTTAPSAGSSAGPAPGAAGPAAHAGTDWSMPDGKEITAFGDSLVVTSAHGLTDRFPGIMIDAKSNRQWPAAKQAVDARLAEGGVRRAVLLDFGTNAGVHDQSLVDSVIDSLGTQRMIVIVNLYGAWVPDGNVALAAVAAKHPNVIIADWHKAISAQPGLLQADGIHPGIKGGLLYADVVKGAFQQLSGRLAADQG